MSIIIVTLCCIALVIVLYFLFRGNDDVKNKEKETIGSHFKPGVDHDTLYFRVTDDKGIVSMIHDSGIKPSEQKKSTEDHIEFPVSKIEYNEGKEKILSRPVKIEIGTQIFDLKNVVPIEEYQVSVKLDHYIVMVTNIW